MKKFFCPSVPHAWFCGIYHYYLYFFKKKIVLVLVPFTTYWKYRRYPQLLLYMDYGLCRMTKSNNQMWLFQSCPNIVDGFSVFAQNKYMVQGDVKSMKQTACICVLELPLTGPETLGKIPPLQIIVATSTFKQVNIY